MSLHTSALTAAVVAAVVLGSSAHVANSASGSVTTDKLGAIKVSYATPYLVRDQRNARNTRTEILLTDVAVDGAAMQSALDPHMIAINLDALKDRNYILLWVGADGVVTMNATFSKTMTQFLNDSSGDLKITWTTNTPARLEGRLFSNGSLKTMDGSAYTVDLKFGVDVPAAPASTALPAGGGDAGKALTAILAAAAKKDWAAIKAGSSPDALKMFDKSYNTPAWIPSAKMKITGGELRGNVAILDVEGELFPGMLGLSRVQMIKTGAVWQFDKAARAGMVK
jgi:hypothetical protein